MATLVRYNNFPTFFNPLYSRPVINRYHHTAQNVPAVNVKENETGFVLELAAPGLKKEDLKISLAANNLTIAYKAAVNDEKAVDTFTRHEFGFTAFERSFRLPKTVNAEAIKAAYTDGILTVELPKVEPKEESAVKEITIA